MALSNIFREPKREITETLVGLAVVIPVAVVFVCLDYRLAMWLAGNMTNPQTGDYVFCMFVSTLGMILGAVVLAVMATVVHAIG